MKRRFVQLNGELVEVGLDYASAPRGEHHIIPDIEPFQANDGAFIRGRAHWREHLKQNALVEMGHSDIKSQGARWEKRKEAQQERLKKSAGVVDATDRMPVDFRPSAPSQLQIEMANRLHDRPAPQRKELIKLALDQAKRMKRG